jgi:metal-responsive CopG/Arc/MetJ family transcriptional regulator
MFGTKVKIEKSLYQKIKIYSDIAGYSSVEEFVHHALEKEIEQFEGAHSEEEIREKLKGLGYIS